MIIEGAGVASDMALPSPRRRSAAPAVLVVGVALVAAACSGPSTGSLDVDAPNAGAPSSTAPSTTIEDYPDAQTRALDRLMRAPRPVPRSALPPRHFDTERFPESLVDRSLIVSGGVAPDAIASVDEPSFEAAGAVDWLDDDEAVLAIEIGDEARAYPIQVMIFHEIVNDTIGDTPVAVTYCPLCNSGVAFDRRVGGRLFDFGTSGSLYQSALVMYDRQTESLWTHFDGRAVVGDRIGDRLTLLPVATVGWDDFRRAHPDGLVLARPDPDVPYGRNPYGSYDSADGPVAGFFRGAVDDRLAPMARVVGVQVDGAEIAVPLDRLRRERLVTIEIGERQVVVAWQAGTTSALDRNRVDEGVDVGATGVFWTDRELVAPAEGSEAAIVDPATGEQWTILGTGLAGADGTMPPPLPAAAHLDTFWFAWSTYHPSTDLQP
ncbi:MAG: DUF3179 domain-containing protein [Actinomycetota bacterium]